MGSSESGRRVRIDTHYDMNPACDICKGWGWVCEGHPAVAWIPGEEFCCGGAGARCECNPEGLMPPGTTILATNAEHPEEKGRTH